MSENGEPLQGNTSSNSDTNTDTLLDLTTQAQALCIPDAQDEPQCCCGDRACAFLADTQAAFDRLDDSLRTAGRLGQALLVRHEAYVADAEAERKRMGADIERLTADKQELSDANAGLIEENKQLLEQLESVNTAVADGEGHIQSLNATLRSTQQELSKLNGLARRTELLEREIEQFERDQAVLQASLALKTEEEKIASSRWQMSERKMAALEDRLEAIENEARVEKERHVEVIGRMERRRAVERDMDTTVTRLQGSALKRASTIEKHGSGVVSHFVKDILQDNANLQMNIVELRDMLANSNDQVEVLREQLAQHIPVEDGEDNLPMVRNSTLNQEMARTSAQEVHVHHHYHAPSPSVAQQDGGTRRQSQTLRRPKKKRQGIPSGTFTPPTGSGFRTPQSSVSSAGFDTPASAGTTLPYSANSNRPSQRHRWSIQSLGTVSSLPESPTSTNYNAPSLFDRSFDDSGMDSSRPTTPDSEAVSSPMYPPAASKRISAGSYKFPPLHLKNEPPEHSDYLEIQAPRPTRIAAKEIMSPTQYEAIPEESGDEERPSSAPRHAPVASMTDDDFYPSTGDGFALRPLRRAASHESLLSVSGMDIHTLQSRPSQLLTGNASRAFSSQAVVSATNAHAARPVMTQSTSDRGSSLLSGMASSQRQAAAMPRGGVIPGKKAGGLSGWMFGRWGASAAPAQLSTGVNLNTVRTRTTNQPTAPAPKKTPAKVRMPGINQPGAIMGLPPTPKISREPVLRTFDAEALMASLNEA